MQERYFPAVLVQKAAGETEAIIGMEMKSLLHGSLFFESSKSSANEHGNNDHAVYVEEHKLIFCRKGFIQAVSAWPKNVTLELLITSLPNLQFRAQGRVLIAIVLRVRAKTEMKARQDVLARYLSLQALLRANLSEAEFVPMMTDDVLRFHLAPFKATNALCVHRRSEDIQLSEPIEKKIVTGLSLNRQPDKTNTRGVFVKFIHPWKESYDDWSRLVHLLMGQLDPVRIIVRLRPAKLTRAQQRILEESIRLCELHLHSGKSFQRSLIRQATRVEKALSCQLASLSDGALNVGVFVMAAHEIDPSLANMLGQSITLKTSAQENDASLHGGFAVSPVNVGKAMNACFYPDKMPFSPAEASCAFRLPSPPVRDIPGLPVRRPRSCGH